MKRLSFPGLAIVYIALSLPAHAHHSTTEFDAFHPSIKIEGKLIEVAWQNPRVHFKLQSVDKSGRTAMATRSPPIDAAAS